MERRSFKLVKNLETNFELASQNHAVSDKQLILNGHTVSEKAIDIKWSACFICQENLKDKLVCPLHSNHKVEHTKQYSNIVNDIRRFENVESISVPLRNLLKIENLEEECVSNKAVYHKRCRSQYNDQHYQIAIKGRKPTEILKTNQVPHEKPDQALTLRILKTSTFYAMNRQQSNFTWLLR